VAPVIHSKVVSVSLLFERCQQDVFTECLVEEDSSDKAVADDDKDVVLDDTISDPEDDEYNPELLRAKAQAKKAAKAAAKSSGGGSGSSKSKSMTKQKKPTKKRSIDATEANSDSTSNSGSSSEGNSGSSTSDSSSSDSDSDSYNSADTDTSVESIDGKKEVAVLSDVSDVEDDDVDATAAATTSTAATDSAATTNTATAATAEAAAAAAAAAEDSTAKSKTGSVDGGSGDDDDDNDSSSSEAKPYVIGETVGNRLLKRRAHKKARAAEAAKAPTVAGAADVGRLVAIVKRGVVYYGEVTAYIPPDAAAAAASAATDSSSAKPSDISSGKAASTTDDIEAGGNGDAAAVPAATNGLNGAAAEPAVKAVSESKEGTFAALTTNGTITTDAIVNGDTIATASTEVAKSADTAAITTEGKGVSKDVVKQTKAATPTSSRSASPTDTTAAADTKASGTKRSKDDTAATSKAAVPQWVCNFDTLELTLKESQLIQALKLRRDQDAKHALDAEKQKRLEFQQRMDALVAQDGNMDTSNIVHGRRSRHSVDYIALNQELFGDGYCAELDDEEHISTATTATAAAAKKRKAASSDCDSDADNGDAADVDAESQDDEGHEETKGSEPCDYMQVMSSSSGSSGSSKGKSSSATNGSSSSGTTSNGVKRDRDTADLAPVTVKSVDTEQPKHGMNSSADDARDAKKPKLDAAGATTGSK
jgi:hypothetical protein